MTEWLKNLLLQVHPPLAYILVFAFAFLEGPLFLGFIVPGELATILGGALVSFENASFLPMAIAASAGAALGDSTGYWMGRWLGPWLLQTRLGRWLEHRHFEAAQTYLKEKGARAVILGRFTAALRVLLPGICGIAHMPYGKFVWANALGCTLWGFSMVGIGYLAGTAWDEASKLAGASSVIVLVIIVALFFIPRLVRRLHKGQKG